ncbi:MAG: hypothetical protein KJ607_12090 [Bacteroidetes bacterium]|nr:hypothetical protein [Bacteroidota bacterium]
MARTRVSFVVFCFSFLIGTAYSINVKEEFPKRKMIVVLYEEDTAHTEDLIKNGKAEEAENYKANIQKYNETLKTGFNEYWNDLQPEFKSQDEVETMTHADLVNYSVLTMTTGADEGVDFFIYKLYFAWIKTNKKGKTSDELTSSSFKVNIQSEFPTKTDLRYIITNMKIYFGIESQFQRDQLEEVLAEKTLYIDEGCLAITEAEIKAVYKFPYKIASSEEIFELTEKNDPQSLYLRLGIETRNQGGGKTARFVDFIIVDCESGKSMARCSLSGLTKVSLNMPSEHHQNQQAEQQALRDYQSGRRSNPVYTGPRGGSFVGKEIARIYTAKAKLKKAQLDYMSSEKKQGSFNPLMLY